MKKGVFHCESGEEKPFVPSKRIVAVNIFEYEKLLAKKYSLPSFRCVYTPDVYWALSKTERDTLHHLRRVR